MAKAEQRSPLAPAPLQDLQRYYRLLPLPALRIGTLALAIGAACGLSLFTPLIEGGAVAVQVLTFHTKARASFAPPCMPDAARAVSGIPRADPGGRVTPRFWHRLIHFRTFIDGLLALASLRPYRLDFLHKLQRSPPWLLTAAACSGLGSAPCPTRRALLHLSYSCASPFGPATLVTHDPERT